MSTKKAFSAIKTVDDVPFATPADIVATKIRSTGQRLTPAKIRRDAEDVDYILEHEKGLQLSAAQKKVVLQYLPNFTTHSVSGKSEEWYAQRLGITLPESHHLQRSPGRKSGESSESATPLQTIKKPHPRRDAQHRSQHQRQAKIRKMFKYLLDDETIAAHQRALIGMMAAVSRGCRWNLERTRRWYPECRCCCGCGEDLET
jgi:hypothetical protein